MTKTHNIGLIFEILNRKITIASMNNRAGDVSWYKTLLKKHFRKGGALMNEFRLYKDLCYDATSDPKSATYVSELVKGVLREAVDNTHYGVTPADIEKDEKAEDKARKEPKGKPSGGGLEKEARLMLHDDEPCAKCGHSLNKHKHAGPNMTTDLANCTQPRCACKQFRPSNKNAIAGRPTGELGSGFSTNSDVRTAHELGLNPTGLPYLGEALRSFWSDVEKHETRKEFLSEEVDPSMYRVITSAFKLISEVRGHKAFSTPKEKAVAVACLTEHIRTNAYGTSLLKAESEVNAIRRSPITPLVHRVLIKKINERYAGKLTEAQQAFMKQILTCTDDAKLRDWMVSELRVVEKAVSKMKPGDETLTEEKRNTLLQSIGSHIQKMQSTISTDALLGEEAVFVMSCQELISVLTNDNSNRK